MDRVDIVIERKTSYSGSIVGTLSVNGDRVCYTLELPWIWNEKGVSCVPNGRYSAFLRYDKGDKWRIQLINVPGRTGVQIHMGAYPRHTKGCVLVGTSTGANQVLGSGSAYRRLKRAFYGAVQASQSPDMNITVEFKGIQATPWGDFAGSGGGPDRRA